MRAVQETPREQEEGGKPLNEVVDEKLKQLEKLKAEMEQIVKVTHVCHEPDCGIIHF
jgi:flagellar motility protein MotE (MotC chaperone)